MRKLGLVGGMGPESTIPYYHDIVYGVQKKIGQKVFPSLTIESVDVFHVLKLCGYKDYDGMTEYLMSAINNLICSGADFVALSAKDGKIRLAFLPQNKNYILHALYPDKYESEEDIFSVSRNSKVNTKLKSEALLHGKQMRYRVLTKEQVKQLAENVGEDKFAVFSKNAKGENLNGQYNIAFNEDDTEKVENALQNPKRKI